MSLTLIVCSTAGWCFRSNGDDSAAHSVSYRVLYEIAQHLAQRCWIGARLRHDVHPGDASWKTSDKPFADAARCALMKTSVTVPARFVRQDVFGTQLPDS